MNCCKCQRGAPYDGQWDEATQCRDCYLLAHLPEAQSSCGGEVPRGSFTISADTFASGGPGTELKKMLAEVGITGWQGCQCEARAKQMDLWGVDGCKEHYAEIIAWLHEASSHVSWGDAFKMLKIVNWLNPYGSLVDEAIKRAAAGGRI